MTAAELLIQRIREGFGEVPFPSHCGLHSAVAMDDWIDDEHVVREITQREDYIGDWWNVPKEHLLRCMMALSYLDASGIEYYLPAYMKAVIEEPSAFDEARIRASSWQVVHTFLPDDEDPELKGYFQERFSKIDGRKKRVCREFLQYVANCAEYNEHAREIAKEALAHEFWSSNSQPGHQADRCVGG